jgi:hypothetical protein
MRHHRLFISAVLIVLAIPALGARLHPAEAQLSPGTVPAHMLVTVEARSGAEDPAVTRDDVVVMQGRDRDQVTGWTPFQSDKPDLQFFVLIDDSSRTSLGTQLEDIRKFITSQRSTAAIGVAYTQNGAVQIAQDPTSDHDRAARALRLPLGAVGAFDSLYLSIEDLIKRWTESPDRREILVISDGVDQFGGTGAANPYVDSAVEKAQSAGIIIYAIYASGVGHWGRTLWRINWGQSYLSEIADETGGESYFLGLETPVSFAPYLDDVNRRLMHQYELEFLAKPGKKAGLQPVKLRSEVPNAELVGAEKVYVPAGS